MINAQKSVGKYEPPPIAERAMYYSTYHIFHLNFLKLCDPVPQCNNAIIELDYYQIFLLDLSLINISPLSGGILHF